MCPTGKFVVKARIKYEDFLGDGFGLQVDDSAANGMQAQCRDREGGSISYLMGNEGDFGTWKNWQGATSDD